MNKITLIGRLTKDISIDTVGENNTSRGRFTLAVNRRKKDDGADFIPCTLMGKSVDNIGKYLVKGTQIAVNGNLRTWTSEKNGQKTFGMGVNVESIEFLGGNKSNSTGTTQSNNVDDDFTPVDDSDMPF